MRVVTLFDYGGCYSTEMREIMKYCYFISCFACGFAVSSPFLWKISSFPIPFIDSHENSLMIFIKKFLKSGFFSSSSDLRTFSEYCFSDIGHDEKQCFENALLTRMNY